MQTAFLVRRAAAPADRRREGAGARVAPRPRGGARSAPWIELLLPALSLPPIEAATTVLLDEDGALPPIHLSATAVFAAVTAVFVVLVLGLLLLPPLLLIAATGSAA